MSNGGFNFSNNTNSNNNFGFNSNNNNGNNNFSQQSLSSTSTKDPQSWQPSNDSIQRVLHVFSDPVAEQASSYQFEQVEQLKQHPEFNLYLAYILSTMKSQPENLRSRCGLALKNNVDSGWENFAQETRNFVKFHCLNAVGDESSFIRNVVGVAISKIAVKDGLENWQVQIPTNSLMNAQFFDNSL
jgi:hypothetical protein